MSRALVVPAVSRAVASATALVFLLIASAWPASAQPLRLDVGAGGVPGNALSVLPVISVDGRYTAFLSEASNLVPGDTDGSSDFFRYDRDSGTLERGDIPLPLGVSEYPNLAAISQDGRWLLFNDLRGDWVAGDANHAYDVFQYDFATGAVRRVSVGAGGADANGGSFAVSMSVDGRFVAFDSWATNLVPPALDNGADHDVFVRDMVSGETVQVSRGLGGLPALGASRGARISPDGEWVAFYSYATNLVGGDPSAIADVYLAHWRTGAILRATPAGVEPDDDTFPSSVSWDGRFVAVETMATTFGPGPVMPNPRGYVWDRLGGGMRALSPALHAQGWVDFSRAVLSLYGRYVMRVGLEPGVARSMIVEDLVSRQSTVVASGLAGRSDMSLDGRFVVFSYTTGGIYLQALAGPPDGLLPTGDADGDGLPNGWEQGFGLSAEAAAGDDGPGGDPDHDGATNLEELQAGTHPRGFHTRHLAEGAENAFFATRIALFNPTGTAAHVRAQFLRADGTPVAEVLEIPAHARRTILGAALEGLSGQSFSVAVEADAAIVVDRTMIWDRDAYGGHSETSVAAASTTWYLAEGSTAGAFDLFYLLENPNQVRADATITWMLPPPLAPVVHSYALPPASRTTLYVDRADVRLASTDAAAVFEATQPIFVERAMYWSRPGQPFAAGHAASAVPAPAARWFLAEGATGAFFETFLLLLNPGSLPAACEVQYLTASGSMLTKPYVLPPASRTTIWVDREEIPGLGRALADATFSTLVTSTNGVPIVVERAMWWPDGDWQEAHDSAGATVTSPRWAIADGDDVRARTYVLIANASAAAGTVRVTLFFEDGTTVARDHPIAAHSRFTVDTGAEFPIAEGRRFGVLVETLGTAPAELVVERATYWNANGTFWAGGTGALATPLP